MNKAKKMLKRLLFPHIAIALLLIPIAIAALVYSMTVLDSSSPVSVAAYVLSAYTLTIWCARIPRIIRYAKRIKTESRLVQRWLGDLPLRVNTGLLGGCLWNLAYAVFQLCLGIYHHTFWYGSLAAYYFLLGLMRLTLVLYTRSHLPGDNPNAEWKRYRTCGWALLIMNLALAVMVFFMVYWGRTFRHHPITTIAMAAYTFTSFTLAIVNLVKKWKFGSPVLLASKAISLAAACVSMLTLTTTMLTAFGNGEDVLFRRLMLALAGGGVSCVIIIMAVYMIRRASKVLNTLKMQEYTYERQE